MSENNSMASKIRIKMGDVEVEYEGSETFLREELRELLSGVLELHREREESGDGSGNHQGSTEEQSPAATVSGTTNTFAAKLSVAKGSDLVIAAAARITLGLGQESFTRGDLLKEMKTAKSYYKKTYSNNLSSYLKSLVSADRIREVAHETYALSAGERQKLESQFAG